MEETKEVELRLQDFWDIFKRCWIVMLAAFIVVGAALYIFLTATHEDAYTASVSIYILRNDSGEDGKTNTVVYNDVSLATQLIKDCKVLMVSRENVLKPVLNEMPTLVNTNWKDLEQMITISGQSDNRILTLSVTSTDRETSAELADKVAEHASEYVNVIYKQPIATIVDHAEVPTEPSNPVSKLKVMLVAFAAAVVVYALYFVVFMLDDKINTAEDVEKYLGVSMLGMIPNRYDSARRRSKYGYGYYASSSPDGEKK